MNTTVTFPIAKLLTEKGIDDESAHYYNEKGELLFDVDFPSLQPTKPHIYYSAPTIADVVMQLYEKYGIWIISVPEGLSTTWAFSLFNINPEKGRIIFNSPSFDSPTEAYEAGIEHILNNLI